MRFFPNRVVIVSIKTLSEHPCPVCKTRLDDVDKIGTVQDEIHRRDRRSLADVDREARLVEKARKDIFTRGYAVSGKKVTGKLCKTSRMPVRVSNGLFFYFRLETDVQCDAR